MDKEIDIKLENTLDTTVDEGLDTTVDEGLDTTVDEDLDDQLEKRLEEKSEEPLYNFLGKTFNMKYFKALKKSKRRYKRILRNQLFLRRLFNPLFIGVYAYAWYLSNLLCKYSEIRKIIPLLTGCVVFFVAYLLAYIVEYFIFLFTVQKNINNKVVQEVIEHVKIEENVATLNTEMESFSFDFCEIKRAKRTGKWIYLYLKKHRFVAIHTKTMEEYDVEFLKLKISQINPLKKINLRLVAIMLLLVITVYGGYGVYKSGIKFNGRLAYFLEDIKDKSTVSLKHNNIYKDGIDGIMKDIKSKIKFPSKLMVSDSFDLNFLANGTITSFQTMLYGYDEQGIYIDSYLISFDAQESSRISIRLGGGISTTPFDENKNFQPLLDAMRVIPLKESLNGWYKITYGILYYGNREWGTSDSIRLIDKDGNVTLPSEKGTISGNTVSVYYDGDSFELPIYRYIYKTPSKE